jgi:hypothetical protein
MKSTPEVRSNSRRRRNPDVAVSRETKPNMLEAALAYAKQGWPIFPCRPGTKEPFKRTHGVKDATTNPEKITKWWTDNPDANIGFNSGAAGLMTRDQDPGHDLAELERNLGEKLEPTQLRVKTPRSGEH